MTVDEPLRGADRGFVVDAIHVDHSDGTIVYPNDQCTVSGHFGLQGKARLQARAERMALTAFECDGECIVCL
ncbi:MULTISPECIES: hypothetical protein [Bradyrhizobium]|uniref:hypothetical protein n=1 Tax=Bradyrhizobium TaxID=374 RepID=UPI000456CDCB|nr:hypothetical protein [Bradyrhizobium japonicum]HEX5517947.1 hypothetical protein [Pseudolabrys sp.]AHY49896.1 hypothetical protein BJS_02736 [Bradyrhizobium japonicum SEMIA 5079]MBR0730151.1 hypothetical protein [Bradyrhizobium japonicum]MBR0758712.1 hypothetical protein [Bradyrhizobium japonicum]MBR0809069.1 hypothetical protein [Bradyrhizobium japonicum]